MDIARLERALAARQAAREWRHNRGYITGEYGMDGVSEFGALSKEKRQEIYNMWQEIEDAKRQSD